MGIWSYVYFISGVPNHLGQGLAMILTIFVLVLLLKRAADDGRAPPSRSAYPGFAIRSLRW